MIIYFRLTSNKTVENNLWFLNNAFCRLFNPILNIDKWNKFELHISIAAKHEPNIIDIKYKLLKCNWIYASTILLVSISDNQSRIELCNWIKFINIGIIKNINENININIYIIFLPEFSSDSDVYIAWITKNISKNNDIKSNQK